MSKNLCYLDLNTASKHYFFYSIFNELLVYYLLVKRKENTILKNLLLSESLRNH